MAKGYLLKNSSNMLTYLFFFLKKESHVKHSNLNWIKKMGSITEDLWIYTDFVMGYTNFFQKEKHV